MPAVPPTGLMSKRSSFGDREEREGGRARVSRQEKGKETDDDVIGQRPYCVLHCCEDEGEVVVVSVE